MKPSTVLFLSDPTAQVLRLLDELPDDTTIVTGTSPEAFAGAAAEADIIVNRNLPLELFREVFSMAPQVRWVHSFSAGVNNSLCEEFVHSTVPLTNGRGAFSRTLAEFAIGVTLYFAKDFPRLLRQQAQGVWQDFDSEEIHGKTMGIVGYGDIGQAVAARAVDFGMKVLATRRRPEKDSEERAGLRILPATAIRKVMAESDYVVVALPLTQETKGVVGAHELAAMKPTGVLINIGRGAAVDERALIEVLREKRIRGAGLDVFETEPLPPGHPFFSMDNVLLSPHTADHVPGWEEPAMRILLDNFKRYRRGEPLRNMVDKELGY